MVWVNIRPREARITNTRPDRGPRSLPACQDHLRLSDVCDFDAVFEPVTRGFPGTADVTCDGLAGHVLSDSDLQLFDGEMKLPVIEAAARIIDPDHALTS